MVRGAWIDLNWLRVSPMVSFWKVLAVIFGIAISMLTIWRSVTFRGEPTEVTCEEIFHLLDEGMVGHARDRSKRLLAGHGRSEKKIGGLAFVLGAVAMYEADLIVDAPYRTRLCQIAAEYLSVAEEKSFLPGREIEGLYLLGKSFFHSQQIERAIPVLEQISDRDSPYVAEIALLLARAYFRKPKPNLERASTGVQQYLSMPGLTPRQFNDGCILHARILFVQGRDEVCLNILDRIVASQRFREEVPILRGRILLRQGDQLVVTTSEDAQKRRVELYHLAIDSFRQVQMCESISVEATRVSGYLIGVTYRKLGDYRAAKGQLERISAAYGDTEEGVAAGLDKAEILRLLDRDKEALTAYRETLRVVGNQREFRNRWISMGDLQQRCLVAYHSFFERGEFESANQIALVMSPVFPRVRVMLLQAEVQQAWANQLFTQAENLDPVPAMSTRQEAERLQRSLGEIHEHLAGIRINTRSYTDDIWNSAEAYLAGRDHESAVLLYREYFRAEPTERRAAAHVGLGRALYALGKHEAAIAEFQACFENYQHDPLSYQARFLCAKSWVKKNETGKARELLLHNLYRFNLTPKNPDWRDSLFELGQIYFYEGSLGIAKINFQCVDTVDRKAIETRLEVLKASCDALEKCEQRLDQAIQQYPIVPQAIYSRYLLANAYRLSSKLSMQKMKNVISKTTRIVLKREAEKNCEDSLKVFWSLTEDLIEQQSHRELTDLERAIQRNSCFFRGDMLYQRQEYDKAIEAYSIVSNRYQRQPETLEAFVQIASCYRQLQKRVEARGTIEQAKIILACIDPNSAFCKTTRFSRDQWSTYLDLLATL